MLVLRCLVGNPYIPFFWCKQNSTAEKEGSLQILSDFEALSSGISPILTQSASNELS